MSDYEKLVDYEWLVESEAGALLDELANTERPLHSAVSWLRKLVSARRAQLLMEQIDLRRRARAKFTAAHRMYFTRRLLEQATDQWVAAYKAERYRGYSTAADLCCGIGGDLVGLAAICSAIGVDRDPVATFLAGVNAARVRNAPANAQVAVEVADVSVWQAAQVAAWHIDPDRRVAARRTSHPTVSSPGMDVVEQLLLQQPAGAVKLAPAAELSTNQQQRCEMEWISCRRACRQLVAWHGGLTSLPGERRATLLSHEDPGADGAGAPTVWGTFGGPPNVPLQIVASPRRFVFDPDPAVLAAQLTGALAQHHGLAAFTPESSYLTGDTLVRDGLLAAFEVLDVLPLDKRQLAAYLTEHQFGRLEIKKRAVDVDPHLLARQLKPRGDRSATIILTPAGGQHRAIVTVRRP